MTYGDNCRLLNGIKSTNDGSEAYIRMNGVERDWFKIKS